MTTPSERVQRLREETTAAEEPSWTADQYPRWLTTEGALAYSVHSDRWNPGTAQRALNLVETVLKHHVCSGFGPWCQTDQQDWPCADAAAALAVLDALDPLSDPSEEGK